MPLVNEEAGRPLASLREEEYEWPLILRLEKLSTLFVRWLRLRSQWKNHPNLLLSLIEHYLFFHPHLFLLHVLLLSRRAAAAHLLLLHQNQDMTFKRIK